MSLFLSLSTVFHYGDITEKALSKAEVLGKGLKGGMAI